MRRRRSRFVILAVCLSWCVCALPRLTAAQCTYNPLTSDTPVASGSATTFYSWTQSPAAWAAVGVRPAAGSNHDIAVFQSTAGSPTCVANQVGASAVSASGVDFVVGDFRAGRNAAGPWYAKATRVSGAGSGQVEWDAGGDEIVVDDDPLVRNTDQVLDVFQVFLEAGVSYVVDFRPSAGVDAKVLVFRNPAAAPYWAGRSAALLESTGPTSFVATTSDEYAVVVVNDDGGLSTYSLAIDQCQPPIDLVSGSPVTTSPPLRYRQNQTVPYWSAVGVRGAGTDDWNLTLFKTGRGTLEPVCFKDTLATSIKPGGGVDFAVGDFTFNPLTAYYARVNQASGSQPGIVEWDDGPDEITVGAPPIDRSTGPGDVLEVWDVYLTAGTQYTIYFQRSGAADARFHLFENALQSSTIPYWAPRAGEVLTGTAMVGYSPAVTGYHGIVVTNENGGVGTYKLTLYGGQVGVGPAGALPSRPTLDGLAPNPAFGGTTITFSLPAPARVGFDVLDVTGRLVEHLPVREMPAGPGRVAWDARSSGERVRPGVYFVRMNCGGIPVGLSKLVLLP